VTEVIHNGPVIRERIPSECLHIVTSEHQSTLTECLSCAADGDSIVFLTSGVMLLQNPAVDPGLFSNRSVYALKSDAMARGVAHNTLLKSVRLIDEQGLVQLVRNSGHSLTWR